MNKKYRKLKMILTAAIVIMFSGIYASAECGRGHAHHRGMHHGQGWHHSGAGGPGCGAFDNLSEDEIKKLEAERTAFFEATKDVRRKIYQKRLELASELAKENPDAAAAAAMQTAISDFKAQMAQKRLEHFLRAQKINPDLGRRFWGGGPMGPGMMHGGMMGPWRHGKWGSHHCPFGGPGCGYGKGHHGRYGMRPGMMGPCREGSWGPDNCPYDSSGRARQMMHRSGYGMEPGYGRRSAMMAPDCSDGVDSRQYHKGEQVSQVE